MIAVTEIEIVKAFDEDWWYSKCIGQKFKVIDQAYWSTIEGHKDCYYVEHPENNDSMILYVLISDCKVTESVAL